MYTSTRCRLPVTVLTTLLLTALSPAPAAAQGIQDTYFWNSPSGTDWMATNAWYFQLDVNAPATWSNGGDGVFNASGTFNVGVSSAVVASTLEFRSPSTVTVTPTSANGSLTMANAATITQTGAITSTIDTRLGGATITVLRGTTSAHTSPVLQLGGANTFTGNLVIGAGGTFSDERNTVRLNSAGAVPSTATVQFSGRNAALSFGSVPSTHTLANAIQLNTSGSNASTFTNFIRAAAPNQVTLSGVISGTGGLTFDTESAAGDGAVFRLTGANTYSGNTTVGSGVTVLVNNPISGTNSATGTGGVTANSGRIGGTGLIGGVDSVTNTGLRFGGAGRLAPGDPAANDGVGQLRVTRNVSWIAGGTYEVQVGGVTDTDADRDQLGTGGILLIDAANAKVNLDVSMVRDIDFAPGQTYTFRIAQANDGITMLGGAGGQFDPSRFEITSTFGQPGDFAVSYEDGVGTANYLVLAYTAVPEPAHVLLVCAAGAGVFAAVRRYRRTSAAVA